MTVYQNRWRRAYIRKRTLVDMAMVTVMTLIISALVTAVVMQIPAAVDYELRATANSVSQ